MLEDLVAHAPEDLLFQVYLQRCHANLHASQAK
jgi:hypothetical protein